METKKVKDKMSNGLCKVSYFIGMLSGISIGMALSAVIRDLIRG